MTKRGEVDSKWQGFVKKVFKRNLNPEIYRDSSKSPYRNVVSMIANRRCRPEISESDKVRLQITPEKTGLTRSEVWFAMMAEFDGRDDGIRVQGSLEKPTHSLLNPRLN